MQVRRVEQWQHRAGDYSLFFFSVAAGVRIPAIALTLPVPRLRGTFL
jgi:hypothetical protein